jgi:uncharacterized iron-regulated membrane protein
MRLKTKLLPLHRWAGLVLGAFLLLQALTGTALVFRDEIERLIYPSMVVKPGPARQPVEALLESVSRSLPDKEVTRVDFPEAPDLAVLVRLKSKQGETHLAAVDPYDARLVRQGGLSAWPTENLFLLHDELWAGDVGQRFLGFAGTGLVFLLITGPILWWPGRKRVRRALSVTFSQGRDRGWRELHRSAGIFAGVILLVSASTGVMMAWQETMRMAISVFAPMIEKPRPKVDVVLWADFLPMDRLVAKAQADYGPTRLQQLRFPGNGGRVVTVYLDSVDSGRPGASKQIWFNRYTGEDLGHYVPGSLPGGNELVDWLFPVHTGQFLGLAGRLLILIGGCSLIGLALTGGWMWYSRKYRRRSRARRPAAQPDLKPSGL